MSEKPEGWEALGIGYVHYTREGNPFYRGTLPFDEGEEVIIFRSSNVNDAIHQETGILKQGFLEMPSYLFDVKQHAEAFPDSLNFTRGDQTVILYLDRKLYGKDFGKEIWIRYISEERGFAEDLGGLEELTELDDNLRDLNPQYPSEELGPQNDEDGWEYRDEADIDEWEDEDTDDWRTNEPDGV